MRRQRWWWILGGSAALLLATASSAWLWVGAAADGRMLTDPAAVPRGRTAIVLGCAPHIGERDNLYFTSRIAAAVALWRAGAITSVLVSGDNGRHGYDEPTAMRDALVAQGVPAARIWRDHAGFRTRDTMLRARAVFGVSEAVLVTQAWHLPRSLFLARDAGIEAVGFAANDVGRRGARLREALARVAAAWDVCWGTPARFGGPQIRVGVDPVN
jgi:SanA protein